MSRVGLVAAALGALLTAAPGGGAAGEPAAPGAERTLAVIPFYAPERMWMLYAPFAEHLSRVTGEPWRLVLHPNHDALIEEFCAGRIDVAFLGPVPLGRANRRCGAAPFLVVLGADGLPEYRSTLLTAEPGVTRLAQLRGRTIGFFKGSTAAHVLPVSMLEAAGLRPGDYGRVFLESQDRLMSAILARRVAAAGVKSALYERFAGQPGLRRIAASDPVPNFAFVSLPSLDAGVRERFARALLRLRPGRRPADARLVHGWDDELRHGFVRPANGFLPAVLSLQALTERVLGDAR